jgi:hypothetical protein
MQCNSRADIVPDVSKLERANAAMPNDHANSNHNPEVQLEELLEREAELRRAYDDNISFLRLVAKSSICSTEEKQRIVGDIDDLRIKLVKVQARIWRIKYGK